MRILSLDSATEAASCAIIDDTKLLGEITFNNEKQHSVILMSMIESLLTRLKMDVTDLDGFVVSKGPGSFTGLRIGMATIKGLSFSSNKPFVSVSTLDALAYNFSFSNGVLCPIMDALRDNVYTALYKNESGELISLWPHQALSVEALAERLKELNEPIYFIGDGIYKHREKLMSLLPDAFFAPPHINVARASSLGELGLKLLKQGISDDLNNSAPVYLRKSQAEREYDKKMGISEDE